MSQAAVEIIAIGNELLLGETVDTNAAWLGRRLASAGIRVVQRATVGDVASDIRSAVEEALGRTGAVLCTGGLGPTPDDMTRPVVAELFGRELELDDALLERLRERFRRRGIEMSPNNRTQAEVPRGGLVFANPRGTAPGIGLEDERGFVVLMPGVPSEVKAIVEHGLLDWLLQRFPERPGPIVHRVIRTTGLAESTLATKIDDIATSLEPLTLAFLPDPTGVDLRLTSWGALSEGEATERLDRADAAISQRLAPWIYARGDEDLVDAIAARLKARGLMLAVAESCTGGLIAKRLTDRAGASDYFAGGAVTYANEAKHALLGVRQETLARYGAVSEETVREMVEGARQSLLAPAAIAVTGIAGPTGGTPDKPVGTVWIAAALGERVEASRHHFLGDRAEIRERAAQTALALLLRMLREGQDANA
ncbi:MAG TPA: competence/damage-inducible protein A [Longimicrobiales bacterium]